MNMLCHYTTIEALFSIIEQMTILSDIDESGQKRENWVLPLRATHIGFLNDSTEGSLLPHALSGMKVSKKRLKVRCCKMASSMFFLFLKRRMT